MSAVQVRPDDIPQMLVDAIRLLPDFDQLTDGWEEQDPSEYPGIGAAFIGEVDDLEVSVAQLRNGSVQLSFARDVESRTIGEDWVTCGVAWLLPSTLSVDENGMAILPCQFRMEGYPDLILEDELLLRLIRLTEELLGGLLLGNPKIFMAQEATSFERKDGEVVPLVDDEIDANAFIRSFVFKIASADL